MKQKVTLYLLLTALVSALCGCGKVGLKDPVYLPGFGHNPIAVSAQTPASPVFKNGDIVKHKLMKDKYGIVMHNRYRYFPDLKAWYYIVDFYPSSAIHLDFSDFDNYERRYVYEFEVKAGEQIPARWKGFALQLN